MIHKHFSGIFRRHSSCRGATENGSRTVFWIWSECLKHAIWLKFQSVHKFYNQCIELKLCFVMHQCIFSPDFLSWSSSVLRSPFQCYVTISAWLSFFIHSFNMFLLYDNDLSYSHCPLIMALERHGVYTSCSTTIFVYFCLIGVSLICSFDHCLCICVLALSLQAVPLTCSEIACPISLPPWP